MSKAKRKRAKTGKRIIKRVVKRVKEILNTHTYLRLDDDGFFYGEIDADYRDEFCDKSIEEIFNAANPRDKFYSMLDFEETDWDYRKDLLETIEEHFDDYDDNNDTLDFSEHEDFIHDWLCVNVIYSYPYDHYLKQDVCIDIIVDTGDGNYEYTKNELFGCNYSEKGLDDRDESALLWLMKQQGYKMDAITEFIENENIQGSKLFKSIYEECLNTTTCINALAFFVKMTLEEAIELYELINRRNEIGYENESTDEEQKPVPTEIIINKNTACGLYDSWNGAGSMLGIELEKDVVLPIKLIDSALPDGCRGYGIASIYGVRRSFWDSGGITIKELEGEAA